MLEFFSAALVSLGLETTRLAQGFQSVDVSALWRPVPIAVSPDTNQAAQTVVQQYLQALATQGFASQQQGVWLQADGQLLAHHQGNVRLPAASLTKVATSLASLEKWGPDYQFGTLVSATGPIKNGVLQGDLIVEGSGDPLFVWEEAIALGNALNQAGIKQVSGNLIIAANFYMNYETKPVVAGSLLRQALDASLWSEEINYWYGEMPPRTPRPRVAIAGSVQVTKLLPPKRILLVRHRSLPLSQILKSMNIYSNNEMSEILAASIGGAQAVSQQVADATGIPLEELQLINGSGLGPENQISPRAVCAMFTALQAYLQPQNATAKSPFTVADLFPVAGRDKGTAEGRRMPAGVVLKTGTLWDVSTLAGFLPTRDRGAVCFAILNRGEDIDKLRDRQDVLLTRLTQVWGTSPTLIPAIAPQVGADDRRYRLGAQERNQVIFKGEATQAAQSKPRSS